MAQRTEAICDGKTIGIETIFTIIDGKQINIPDKLKWLREKSRNGELFAHVGVVQTSSLLQETGISESSISG